MNWFQHLIHFNDWITTPNITYQAVHALMGFWSVTIMGRSKRWWVAALVLAIIAVKEFWFDPHFEVEAISGGTLGDIADFLFYAVGVGVALWRFHLHRKDEACEKCHTK